MIKHDEDYPYIRPWHSGSGYGYVNELIAKARATNAPQDAIYERDGVWATVDGIRSDEARERIGAPPATPKRKAEFAYAFLRAVTERPNGMQLDLHDLIAIHLHQMGVTSDAFQAVYMDHQNDPRVRALGIMHTIMGRLIAIEQGQINPKDYRVGLKLLSNIETDDDFHI